MGGQDKPSLYVGDATLLDRVLLALPECARVVIVGAERPTPRPVLWTREAVPGSGPVPALAAGLAHVTSDRVLLLAADLPFLTSVVLTRLLAAIDQDGALLVDTEGRDQYLCSAWRTQVLRTAALAQPRLGAVLAPLRAARVRLPGGPQAAWYDCDTPAELEAAREQA
jgi:molybdopterin-guanine dinucleotide biosynthesis protein A